jgi:hypothetical protein
VWHQPACDVGQPAIQRGTVLVAQFDAQVAEMIAVTVVFQHAAVQFHFEIPDWSSAHSGDEGPTALDPPPELRTHRLGHHVKRHTGHLDLDTDAAWAAVQRVRPG